MLCTALFYKNAIERTFEERLKIVGENLRFLRKIFLAFLKALSYTETKKWWEMVNHCIEME